MVKLDLFDEAPRSDLYRLEGQEQAELDYNKFRPTLYDVGLSFENYYNIIKETRRSLVGERHTSLATFVAFVMRKKSVYIRSYAGSGKTEISEAVVSVVPRHKLYVLDNLSEKAIWHAEDAINAAELCYVGELQKVKDDFVEVVKSWAEGRAATREITQGQGETRHVHLDVKPVLVTQAFENKDAKEVNDEFLRRVYDLRTDPSAAQTRRVKKSKMGARANPWAKRGLDAVQESLLGQHIAVAMDIPIRGYATPGIDKDGGFEAYIPEDYVIARSYTDHFLDLAEGIARFHHYDRMTHDGYLLVTPADVYTAVMLVGKELRLACYRLDPEDIAIIQTLPEVQQKADGKWEASGKEKLSESQVMAGLASIGLNLEKGKVRERLVKLSMMTPYVDADRDTSPHRYYRSGVTSAFEAEVDWARVVNDMAQGAREVLPKEIADEYVARYCGPDASVVSAISGESIRLRDSVRKAVPVHDTPRRPTAQPGSLLAYDQGS